MPCHEMATFKSFLHLFLLIFNCKDHVSSTLALRYLKLPKTSIVSSHHVFCPSTLILASVLTLACQTDFHSNRAGIFRFEKSSFSWKRRRDSCEMSGFEVKPAVWISDGLVCTGCCHEGVVRLTGYCVPNSEQADYWISFSVVCENPLGARSHRKTPVFTHFLQRSLFLLAFLDVYPEN